VLRELYLMRDQKAREMDRPPFKVLGNRTLIEIAERLPRKLAELAEIKGITDLLIRRLGRDALSAVRAGRASEHGPIPKLPSSGRRRMDRHAERRLIALKQWRSRRAAELSMDPGVLCPNSTLETIALRSAPGARDLESQSELKRWFAREFGAEVAAILAAADAAPRED
jgi:ribonuclease D